MFHKTNREQAAVKEGIFQQNSKLRPSLSRMPRCGLLLDGIVLQCSPRPFEVRPTALRLLMPSDYTMIPKFNRIFFYREQHNMVLGIAFSPFSGMSSWCYLGCY